MAQRICDLVDDLPNSIDKCDNLQKINILVSEIHPQNITDIVSNISFNLIFECLVTNDRRQIDVCCDVLEKLLVGVDSQALLLQFSEDLEQGFSHPDERVKQLCLRQARRLTESCPQLLTEQRAILKQLVVQIGDDELSVAKEAANTLILLAHHEDSLSCLLHGDGLTTAQQLLEQNDTIRYRLYELIVDISRLSKENLTLCQESGILQRLANDVCKDDVLVQLNAIELLTRLASVHHGLAFMEEVGIMALMDDMMKNVNTDPMISFLLPGLVKFFGGVAYLQPKEVCSRHTDFLPLVFSLHENHDPTTQSLAAETLGFIGRTIDGKRILEQHGTRMMAACKHLGNMLRSSSNELKIKVLGALENLFTLPVENQTSDLLSLCESWYARLAPQPMTLFMYLLEQPFPDLRNALYALLIAMATQAWAQCAFRDHAGFAEFLLDRSTENYKEGKELKFDVIQTLSDSPTCVEVLGRVYCVKLKEYVKEGPFYKPAQSAVAMDMET